MLVTNKQRTTDSSKQAHPTNICTYLHKMSCKVVCVEAFSWNQRSVGLLPPCFSSSFPSSIIEHIFNQTKWKHGIVMIDTRQGCLDLRQVFWTDVGFILFFIMVLSLAYVVVCYKRTLNYVWRNKKRTNKKEERQNRTEEKMFPWGDHKWSYFVFFPFSSFIVVGWWWLRWNGWLDGWKVVE